MADAPARNDATAPRRRADAEPEKAGVIEQNLCTLYGDHDECPYEEVDKNGAVTLCSCSCHLFPEASPE